MIVDGEWAITFHPCEMVNPSELVLVSLHVFTVSEKDLRDELGRELRTGQ